MGGGGSNVGTWNLTDALKGNSLQTKFYGPALDNCK